MTGGRFSGGPYVGASATRHPVVGNAQARASAKGIPNLPCDWRANVEIGLDADADDALRRSPDSHVAVMRFTALK
jgi:hypothetical protein